MRFVLLCSLAACTVPAVPKPAGDDTDTDAATVDTDGVGDPPEDTVDSVDPVDTPEADTPDAVDTPADTGCQSGDTDQDGVLDCEDLCVNVANPLQTDLDGDDEGDECDLDIDGDSVPNDFDEWPLDPMWPGVATSETIYPHTSSELFSFNVVTLNLNRIGAFQVGGGQVTDIAINQFGVLYAITFTDLYICRPSDANCRQIGTLSGISNNGLTFLPPAAVGGPGTLVGMGGNDWFEIYDNGNRWRSRPIGSFTGGATSSGDAFSIEGVGTFAALQESNNGPSDDIYAINPANGATLGLVVTFDRGGGYSQIWGLAGWTDGYIYAFDAGGDILRVDVANQSYARVDSTNHSWWGAGVRTVIPTP